ncbi:MAG: hypothetical protein IKE05_04425, partial [Clostridia bacterium]|nr:hypothetical protein [Clostridia bacterium]
MGIFTSRQKEFYKDMFKDMPPYDSTSFKKMKDTFRGQIAHIEKTCQKWQKKCKGEDTLKSLSAIEQSATKLKILLSTKIDPEKDDIESLDSIFNGCDKLGQAFNEAANRKYRHRFRKSTLDYAKTQTMFRGLFKQLSDNDWRHSIIKKFKNVFRNDKQKALSADLLKALNEIKINIPDNNKNDYGDIWKNLWSLKDDILTKWRNKFDGDQKKDYGQTYWAFKELYEAADKLVTNLTQNKDQMSELNNQKKKDLLECFRNFSETFERVAKGNNYETYSPLQSDAIRKKLTEFAKALDPDDANAIRSGNTFLQSGSSNKLAFFKDLRKINFRVDDNTTDLNRFVSLIVEDLGKLKDLCDTWINICGDVVSNIPDKNLLKYIKTATEWLIKNLKELNNAGVVQEKVGDPIFQKYFVELKKSMDEAINYSSKYSIFNYCPTKNKLEYLADKVDPYYKQG